MEGMASSAGAPRGVASKKLLLLLALKYLERKHHLVSESEVISDPFQAAKRIAEKVEAYFELRNDLISRNLIASLFGIDIRTLGKWIEIAGQSTHERSFPKWFVDQLDDLDFGGRHATPSLIANFVANLICDSATRTVLDPACGTGSFLASATEISRKAMIAGRDFSAEACGWAQLRCLILGHSKVTFAVGDPFGDPTPRESSQEKFQVVLCNPPFGLPKTSGRLASETAFVKLIVGKLSSTGRGAVIVPNGFLFRSGSDQKLRQSLVESDAVQAVIGLPGGLFAPMTAIETAILVLNRQKPANQKGTIVFVDAAKVGRRLGSRRTLDTKTIEQITSMVWEGSCEANFAQIVTLTKLRSDFSLLPARYVVSPSGVDQVDPTERRAEISEADSHLGDLIKDYEALRTKLTR
jgi:type I restriction enzyme M protein